MMNFSDQNRECIPYIRGADSFDGTSGVCCFCYPVRYYCLSRVSAVHPTDTHGAAGLAARRAADERAECPYRFPGLLCPPVALYAERVDFASAPAVLRCAVAGLRLN